MAKRKSIRTQLRKYSIADLRALIAWIYATFPEIRKGKRSESSTKRRSKGRKNSRAARAMKYKHAHGCTLKEAWRHV